MRDLPSRRARVVSVGKNAAWIAFEHEDFLRPAALRKHLERLHLAPGDLVQARALDGERAVVDAREPRSFALERTTASGRTKTMAANIDAVAIVAAFDQPPLHLSMIDELLAFAEIHEIRPFILLTKSDLVPEERRTTILSAYRSLGYAAFELQPKNGIGIDAIRLRLREHRSLLIGQSGVGKSSLFLALGGTAVVGAVSKHGRGRQTTTSGRLHRLGEGWIIDSPGIGDFELRGLPWDEVIQGFVDLRALMGKCRFRDCAHRSEPDCAIRAACAAGAIARERYESYLAILEREK